ncbi:hypothetical protein ABB37_08003 [Leptomonas pyrrhocoris]|uniref:Transmembrane protein n=1 Tax=Leptomonas pyrrhocoris TaxID=157538 RepID=A0A0M9FUK8_LEPPY|nr:hypothetical protein ABB37_08003 [Leptomonas pyrrhocoris]KPA76267.1 hypothetical protein ABB37_08003 [Leptomonas pyrrhocoris]|eukprot:XP_015654706.1 hypothetical protein ABB37_08003 [Leptomonas pyrrhocoris]
MKSHHVTVELLDAVVVPVAAPAHGPESPSQAAGASAFLSTTDDNAASVPPLTSTVMAAASVDTPSSTFEAAICTELQRLIDHCEEVWAHTMRLTRVAVRSVVMDQNYAIAVTCVMLLISCVLYPLTQTLLCTVLFFVLYGLCMGLQGYHFWARVTEMKYRTASVTSEVLTRWWHRVHEMPLRQSQTAEERRRVFIESFAQLPAKAFRMVAVVDERTDRLKHIHKSLMVKRSKRLDEATLKVRPYIEPVGICKLIDVMRITLESDAIVLKPLTDRARPPRLPNLMLSNATFIEDEDTTDDSDNERESRTALGGGNTISVSHHMEYFVHRVFLLFWGLAMLLTAGAGVVFYFTVAAPLGEGVFLDPAVALLGLLPLNAIVLNRFLIFYANVYLDKLFHYMVSRRSYALDDRLPRFSFWPTVVTMARVVFRMPPPNGGRNPLVFATSLVDVFGMATVVAMLDQTGIVTDMVPLPRQILLLKRDPKQESSSSEDSDVGAVSASAAASFSQRSEREARERRRDMRKQIKRKKYQEQRFVELRLAQSSRQDLAVEFADDDKAVQKSSNYLNPLCLAILVHALAREPTQLATWTEPFRFCDRSLRWSRALHWIPRACGFHDSVARNFLVLARIFVIHTKAASGYRDTFPEQACSYLVEGSDGALHLFTMGTPYLVCRHSSSHWTGASVEEFDEGDKAEVLYMGKHQWEEGQSLETVALSHRILPERYRRYVATLPRNPHRYSEFFFRNGAEVNGTTTKAARAGRRRRREAWAATRASKAAVAAERAGGEGAEEREEERREGSSSGGAHTRTTNRFPRRAVRKTARGEMGQPPRESSSAVASTRMADHSEEEGGEDGPFGRTFKARDRAETFMYTSDAEEHNNGSVRRMSSSHRQGGEEEMREEDDRRLDGYTAGRKNDEEGEEDQYEESELDPHMAGSSSSSLNKSGGGSGSGSGTSGASRNHPRHGRRSRRRCRSVPPPPSPCTTRPPALKSRSRSLGAVPSDVVGDIEEDDCLTASTFIRLMATTSHTFLGLVGLQDSVRPNVQSTMALLDGAGVRCMYFCADNERQTKSFGSRVGLETDWNCCISLKEDAVALDPHSIRAQLPFGMKSIRKHILHVDAIPLQVSLFSHALGVSKRAMLSVLQDNHEVVVAVGSVFSHSNVRSFVQADLSIGVLPTRRGPNADKDATLKHSRIVEPSDFAVANSLNRDIPLYRNVAELIGCSCSLRAPPTTSILPIVAMMIRQARLRLSGIGNGVEFVLHANFFLVVVNVVFLVAGAPLLLTPSVTVFELYVQIPILATCCTYTAFAGMDPMRVMPSRHNHFVRRAIFRHSVVVWCLRYTASAVALLALGLTASTRLCHARVVDLINLDDQECVGAAQGYVALTFNYWLMVHCWTHISRHNPISPTFSLKLAHGRRSTYLFKSFRWLSASLAVSLLSVVAVVLDTPMGVLGRAFFPSVAHFVVALLFPLLILALDWPIKRWRERRFTNMQKFRKLSYGTRLGMHSPRGDYEPEGVTYNTTAATSTNAAGLSTGGSGSGEDISVPENASVMTRVSEWFYRFASMRGGKLELNCVCCDHIGGNYATYHTVANV